MVSNPDLDRTIKENCILKERCYSFTHGNWCKMCELQCHHHDDENELRHKYENLGYNK